MNTLLWIAQIVLACLQVLSFLSSLLVFFSGRVQNVIRAAAWSGLGLLLGVGIVVPWWSQQAMVLTPVAASLLALLVLFDGLTKQGSPLASDPRAPRNAQDLLARHSDHRFANFDALYLSLVFLLAVLVAIGRIREFGQWNNSVIGWLIVLGGTMTLVVCLLRSSEGPSRQRWGLAGGGLLAMLAGCLNMLVN